MEQRVAALPVRRLRRSAGLSAGLLARSARQVLALTAQCPAAAGYTEWISAVDDGVDPTDFNEVTWALSTPCHPAEDIDILK